MFTYIHIYISIKLEVEPTRGRAAASQIRPRPLPSLLLKKLTAGWKNQAKFLPSMLMVSFLSVPSCLVTPLTQARPGCIMWYGTYCPLSHPPPKKTKTYKCQKLLCQELKGLSLQDFHRATMVAVSSNAFPFQGLVLAVCFSFLRVISGQLPSMKLPRLSNITMLKPTQFSLFLSNSSSVPDPND